MKEKISGKQLFDYIRHYKFEDNLSWSFCAGILKQNFDIIISSETLRNRVTKYIKDNNIEIKKE